MESHRRLGLVFHAHVQLSSEARFLCDDAARGSRIGTIRFCRCVCYISCPWYQLSISVPVCVNQSSLKHKIKNCFLTFLPYIEQRNRITEEQDKGHVGRCYESDWRMHFINNGNVMDYLIHSHAVLAIPNNQSDLSCPAILRHKKILQFGAEN